MHCNILCLKPTRQFSLSVKLVVVNKWTKWSIATLYGLTLAVSASSQYCWPISSSFNVIDLSDSIFCCKLVSSSSCYKLIQSNKGLLEVSRKGIILDIPYQEPHLLPSFYSDTMQYQYLKVQYQSLICLPYGLLVSN